jgi:hypothetical protein
MAYGVSRHNRPTCHDHRMSKLRLIWFWPGMGYADRPWTDHPDEDAFARGSNSVWELYTEAVKTANIENRHSEVRLTCRHEDREDVLVEVFPEETEGFEMGTVLIPPGIAALTPQARAELVLEATHAAASRLGQARGWDQAALDAARAHVLAAGLHFRWTGPAKTSPDRRHVAEPIYAIYPDGYGRVVVRIRRRATGEVVASSPIAPEHGLRSAFAENATTLRWRSRTQVEFTPGSGLAIDPSGATIRGSDHPEPIVVDLADPGTFGDPAGLPPVAYDPAAATVPAVRVWTPQEAGPRIRFVGGGFSDGVPARYWHELYRLLSQIEDPAWQSWWSAAAGYKTLDVTFDMYANTPGVSARRAAGDELRASIRRPVKSIHLERDKAGLARADVAALLSTVRRRTGLSEPPPFR